MPRATIEELTVRLMETINLIKHLCSEVGDSITPKDEAAMERWVQLAIQLCIDLGDHIVMARNLDEPPTARDLFLLMSQERVLPGDLGRAFSDFVSLRNGLVHDYVVYSGPGIIAEAVRILPTLEKGAALLSTVAVAECEAKI